MTVDLAVSHPWKVYLSAPAVVAEAGRIFGQGTVYRGITRGNTFTVVRLSMPRCDVYRKMMKASPKGTRALFLFNECWVVKEIPDANQ